MYEIKKVAKRHGTDYRNEFTINMRENIQCIKWCERKRNRSCLLTFAKLIPVKMVKTTVKWNWSLCIKSNNLLTIKNMLYLSVLFYGLCRMSAVSSWLSLSGVGNSNYPKILKKIIDALEDSIRKRKNRSIVYIGVYIQFRSGQIQRSSEKSLNSV